MTHPHPRFKLLGALAAATAVVALSACSGEAASTESSAESAETVTIEHAFGETEIEGTPERVATVAWANHEVPLALGVVPVGMAAANFGDDDGDGVLPWVEEKLEELGAETPVLFDEGDGIDFEAVADTNPDVILAAYSGLDQQAYDTLSEIAPVVAFPETAWGTNWRDMITFNSLGMGMAEEGEQLIADIEAEIDTKVSEYPELEGKSAMFLTHVDESDLSTVSYYSTLDPRVQFFDDLGMGSPESVVQASEENGTFSVEQSAETADEFADAELIVTYGGPELLEALKADPILSQMPAVENDAVVRLGSDPLGTAANPTPLAISWVLDDYLKLLADAAE
ncbi:iron-siderophore ABC transporter substrate-binding protein [Zhihengliuella flava]|uniref:Iron complex transport system substrate-binding protein n=1 Tax=Zhihengliuella flava TaxID=1285193 RepID=A0A931GM69_9MICC|nr:iron-siderophore ABC transporter substrate-binding protein [Zhihengliuella flava]MBG6085129.1 iron complex transport system substrate-binding protein [Zhihengliuella flava]